MVRQLDAKRRVNSMLNVDDTVWVGTIGTVALQLVSCTVCWNSQSLSLSLCVCVSVVGERRIDPNPQCF